MHILYDTKQIIKNTIKHLFISKKTLLFTNNSTKKDKNIE